MREFVDLVLPLFVVIGLGAALRNTGFMPLQVFHQTNRLLFWIALPAYLFYKTAESRLEGDAAVRVFSVLLGGMIAGILLAYLLARLLRLEPKRTGAFVQGAYRSNLVYVGLPVVLLAVSERAGVDAPALQATAVVSVALLMPIYSTVAVLVLLGGQAHERSQLRLRLRELGTKLITNPLILACAAGLVVLATDWQLPRPVRQTCAILGDMTTPLALLGIGASLTFTTLRDHWRDASLSATIKVIGSPLAGILIAGGVGLSAQELRIALILLACPAAATSYIMAQQLGSDEGLAANIVVVSTLLSMPALGAVIALT